VLACVETRDQYVLKAHSRNAMDCTKAGGSAALDPPCFSLNNSDTIIMCVAAKALH